MVDVVERDDGRLIDFGDRVRVERRGKAEDDGTYVWVVYQKADIQPNAEGVRIHPVHGQPTDFTYVWLIVGQGTEAEARAQALALAGG